MSGGTRRKLRTLAAAILALTLGGVASQTRGQQESVIGTLHNLSVSGPGEIRALSETEVCKFCHVPHNAEGATPLWGRPLSTAQYETPELRVGTGGPVPAPQPDGSSRLCLSCHDGTIALGDVSGAAGRVPMTGPARLGAGRRGFLGTDLSGSHPISFVVPDGDLGLETDGGDMALLPLAVVTADPDVRLDAEGKMQCTTCHDAHSDGYYRPGQVPRFWVKPSYEEVCLACHALR